MPTILKKGPYRIYFYSHEPNEPPPVHIDRDRLSAKFWLNPIGLARNFGFAAKELRKLQLLVEEYQREFWMRGMGILALAADERVAQVKCTDDTLSVTLMDGKAINVPLTWYPRLLKATPSERKNWQIIGGGYGIHWPDVDEDLSTEGLLRGAPAPQKLAHNIKPHTVVKKEITTKGAAPDLQIRTRPVVYAMESV